MELYFLRHAKAVQLSARSKMSDRDRPLTPEGEQKMRAVARGFRRLDLSLDLILSSPYLRARQTAEILADVLKAPGKLKLAPALEPGGDPRQLVRELNQHGRQSDGLVLVGHEPYFSELISMLIAGHTDVRLDVKKASLCKVTTTSLRYGQCAVLEWLLPPGYLALLGKS